MCFKCKKPVKEENIHASKSGEWNNYHKICVYICDNKKCDRNGLLSRICSFKEK